ncbi:MAG: FtsX-like permease family protein [Chloroflexi bacterium]|jgi:putative ABC transport system permease protein|nr:FtsX-like permease family protein [Chloroflexota bacterium]
MSLLESLTMALRSLRANKLRASLTMLGIIIGTGAVIGLLSVGEGARAAITAQVQGIGSNLIIVIPGNISQFQQGMGGGRSVEALTRQDAEAIADDPYVEHVEAVVPEVERTGTVTYRGETVTVAVRGATADYEIVRNHTVAYGRFIAPGDDAAAARVALLGYQTAKDLFGDPDSALDQTIRIDRIPFRVVGVMEEKGGAGPAGFRNPDAFVLVPLGTAVKRLYPGRYMTASGVRVDTLYISAVEEASVDAAIDEVTMVLRERHRIEFEEDDFTVASQKEILGVFNAITQYLTIFLAAIAGISLLVGGIGIMNIMLVSVTERTREIGIRKAVGAKRRDILWQFLIESVLLSVVGGALGIALGWGLASIVNSLGAFTTVVSGQAVLLAVTFSVFVGLFFGIYPANRAANLDPIEALRYE